MTVQERFDYITSRIEELVIQVKNKDDIIKCITNELAMNERKLGDCFDFLTNLSITTYIRQRYLINALKYKVYKGYSIDEIISYTNYSDASALSHSCKTVFGLSPDEFTENIIKKYPQLTFSHVISEDYIHHSAEVTMTKSTAINNIQRISSEQFAVVKQFLDIGALYGFNDNEVEEVYRLSIYCNASASKIADFYEDFKLQKDNGSYNKTLSLYDVAELSFKYNLSYSESQSILLKIRHHGYKSIHDLPEGFFTIYFSPENELYNGWTIPHICKIIKELNAHGFSAKDIPEILADSDAWGVDPVTYIQEHDEFSSLYDKLYDEYKQLSKDDNEQLS